MFKRTLARTKLATEFESYLRCTVAFVTEQHTPLSTQHPWQGGGLRLSQLDKTSAMHAADRQQATAYHGANFVRYERSVFPNLYIHRRRT